MTNWLHEALALQDRRNELLAQRLDAERFSIVGRLASILEWVLAMEPDPYDRED